MTLVKRSREEKKQLERWAAEVFLNWYNTNSHTQCEKLIDTIDKFPTINASKNWDFVAENANQEFWIAIECKHIAHEKANREADTWRKIFEKINLRLTNKLRGSYRVSSAPDLREILDQTHINELVEATCSRILEIDNTNIFLYETVDIWPSIYAKLNSWPKRYNFGLRQNMHLQKMREGESGIKLYALFSHCDINNDEKQGISSLFSTDNNGRIKADAQLAVAKKYGAAKTIFLIDGYLDLLTDIQNVVSSINKSLILNIDIIALVDKGLKEIRQVEWVKG